MGRSRAGKGTARADARIEDHPFAGLEVTADAFVTDAAGQEGRPSDDGAMVLPSRPFRNPVAKALVEQRRNLALDARNQYEVADALDAMMIAPERLQNPSVYLGLRVGRSRLLAAKDDESLRGMLDYLWQMALAIEDGAMSDAQAALQAAREALQEALERGASDEEIARLTEELRQAMQDYMQSLAEQMARQGEMPPMPLDPNTQILSQQDLERMLDRIEELAQMGDREAAQELLSQLQQMLDNMQMAQQGMQQMQQGPAGEMMQQMEELARMMREQQRLMDEKIGRAHV